jgi:hypothetical protein
MKTFITIALVDHPPIVIDNPSDADAQLLTGFISALLRNDEQELSRTRLLYADAPLSSVVSIAVGRRYPTGAGA